MEIFGKGQVQIEPSDKKKHFVLRIIGFYLAKYDWIIHFQAPQTVYSLKTQN